MTILNAISLGAGVQSSTMALMAAHGELQPMPDCAIFADTQSEPKAVYEYLAYLKPLLPFPVHVVSAGNLGDDFLKALDSETVRCGSPPFMVKSQSGDAARLWRQCTEDYKIAPIRRKLQELRLGRNVRQWIGISLDEAHRMKPSKVRYIENVYPLVDLRMKRQDCLKWLENHGYNIPPKSACIFCPYIDDNRLRQLRDSSIDEWNSLVQYDAEMRNRQKQTTNGTRITGTLYVHRSCIPILEVDLRTAKDHGQLDLFGEECEGMCGV